MAAARAPRPLVLAVDDDPSILDVLHLVLDDRYDVLDASDGERALALVGARSPDLILLDLVMQRMDGITLLERLRADGVDVPVVILSAINTAWTAAAAMRLGAVDYVTKPFDDRFRLSVIDGALYRAAEAAELRPVSETPRIVLMGCPVGLAAAVTGALAPHAWIESVALDDEALAPLPPRSPDAVVVDPGTGASPRAILSKIRARFPLAPVLVLTTAAGGRGAAFDAEAEGCTALPRPVSLRDLLEAIRAELRPSARALPHFSARVVGVMEYVSTHLAEVSMRELGRTLETSPYYLSRLFHAETGVTLKTYVSRVRVEAARRLLVETSEKIDAVAASVGFHDGSHLSRQFLRYSGRRPGDVRRARTS
jgi:DNA-binding response OmpR family regulator